MPSTLTCRPFPARRAGRRTRTSIATANSVEPG
jgi:hypothetical protein